MVINISQFLPKVNYFKNLGKGKRANFLLYKALIETFGHYVRFWYDFLHEVILVFRADFGAWTNLNARRLRSTFPHVVVQEATCCFTRKRDRAEKQLVLIRKCNVRKH